MNSNKTEDVLTSIMEILRHIDTVQKDVLSLSERSGVQFGQYLLDNGLTPDDKLSQAFQYQDIIAQQLGAVSEAVGLMEKNIGIYLHAIRNDQNQLGESIDRLADKLLRSLQKAKAKQESFSGNALGIRCADEINFF